MNRLDSTLDSTANDRQPSRAATGSECLGVALPTMEKHRLRRLHFAFAVGGIVFLLAMLWRFDPAAVHLPLCQFHAMTGLDCPGCGATRATHELLNGRLAAAWRYNALWTLLFPVVLYGMISECRVLSGGRSLPGNLFERGAFWIAVLVVAVVFFIVRNLPF
jgi:hypothetical protein